ncbi:MAG: ABC transporter ATP-binding protein [Clostridia bacterium]|nr:ABC transporter ATP-binding protein [Clostridia bacterium]
MTKVLEVRNVTVRYGEHTVLDRLSFSLQEGQWLMLAGPNGAGKSTMIETIFEGTPYTGEIFLEGKNVRKYKPHLLAQKIGVMAQKNSVGYGYTVEEVVGLGRYAHSSGFLVNRDDEGKKLVDEALEKTGLMHLRKASVLTLSGGELQRTFLAQVFAQNPQILILDEPANHLDLVYQKHIFSLIQEWLAFPGRAVLSVVHDLSLAKKYGTHTILVNGGQAAAYGKTEEVLTRENLKKVYDMDVYAWMRGMLEQWTEEN